MPNIVRPFKKDQPYSTGPAAIKHSRLPIVQTKTVLQKQRGCRTIPLATKMSVCSAPAAALLGRTNQALGNPPSGRDTRPRVG